MPLGPPNRSASARRSFRRASGRAQADHPESAEAARRVALALLARRDYARTELGYKLQAKGFGESAIAEALAALEAERLLDDQRFVDTFVRSHAQRGQGPGRIRRELQALGLESQAIDQALGEATDFVALCREVRERKFGRKLPASWPEKSRQARFLQYRGFSSDHIQLALGQNPEWADSDTDPNEDLNE